MNALGFSINTLTLFGITLATGLVVDDAIVVIENISRLIKERSLGGVEAAQESMKEITGAVIAISLVLGAVFIPVAFFPGTTGLLYRQFALTIACSVGISTFISLTLTPALSAKWLKPHSEKKSIIFAPINMFLDWLKKVMSGRFAWHLKSSRWSCRFLCVHGAHLLAFHDGTERIRAERRPGLFHHHRRIS